MNPGQILEKQDSGIVTDQSFDDENLPVEHANERQQGGGFEDDGFSDFPFVYCLPDVLRILPPNDPSFIVSPVESVASEISLPFSEVAINPDLLEVRRQSGSVTSLFSPIFQQVVAEIRVADRSLATLVNEPLVRNKTRDVPPVTPFPDHIYEKLDAIMNEPVGGDTSSEGSMSDNGKEESGKTVVDAGDPEVKKEKVVEVYDSRTHCWKVRGAVDEVVVLECAGPSGPLEEILPAIECDPVPYQVLEVSRLKCDEWLEKHYVEGKKTLSVKMSEAAVRFPSDNI